MDPLSLFCLATSVAAALSLIAFIVFSFFLRKSPAGRRVSLIFVGVFGIASVTGLVYLADRDPELMPLGKMEAAFPANQPRLEELLRMSDEDKGFTGVAADYLTAAPTAASPTALYRYGDPRSPLGKPRWDDYKSRLDSFGSLATLERSEFGDVTIYTWNGPWRGLYRATGYVHCTDSAQLPATDTSFRRKPCGQAVLLDATGVGVASGNHPKFSNFVPLKEGWWAFEIGID